MLGSAESRPAVRCDARRLLVPKEALRLNRSPKAIYFRPAAGQFYHPNKSRTTSTNSQTGRVQTKSEITASTAKTKNSRASKSVIRTSLAHGHTSIQDPLTSCCLL